MNRKAWNVTAWGLVVLVACGFLQIAHADQQLSWLGAIAVLVVIGCAVAAVTLAWRKYPDEDDPEVPERKDV